MTVKEILCKISEKHVYIYGVGRRTLDFMYMFPEVKICGYISTQGNSARVCKGNIVELNAIEEKDNVFIIVCAEIDAARHELEKWDLVEGVHYVSVLETVKLLDFSYEQLLNKKKIVLLAPTLLKKDTDDFLEYYGSDLVDEMVIKEDKYEVSKDAFYIMPPQPEWKRTIENLGKEGLTYGIDFFSWNRKEEWASKLYSRMFYEQPKNVPFCSFPFAECMEIFPNGGCFSCCINWLPIAVGNIDCGGMQETWRSNRAKLIQLSMVNRTYAFCDLKNCQRMLQYYGEHEEFDVDYIVSENDYSLQAQKSPKELSIAIDYTCNLYCSSCRKVRMIATGEQKAEMMKKAEKINREFLPHVQAIKLAGTGEVFASEVYKKIIYNTDCERKIPQLTILTNGLLFTKENFERLEPLYDEIYMDVSIDGATKETYEKLRRGGKWETICKNMEYASKLRKEGRLKNIQFNYVFSTENYQEMPQYIKWADELGVDKINFMRVLYMPGAMTEQEFERLTLFDGNGDLKEEYKEFFLQEIFKNPIVIRSTLPLQ